MARFVFELEALLRVRVREEQERQGAVAVLERERLDIEARIRRYQQQMTGERREIADRMRGGAVSMRDVSRQAGVASALHMRAQREAISLAGIHKRLDAARAALLQASKRRKAVEKLKERRYERWRSEQDRRESIELDELGVLSAARQRNHS
jgi:flagellar FliJ protein